MSEETQPTTHRRIVILGVNERIGPLLTLLEEQGVEMFVIAEDISNFEKVFAEHSVDVLIGDFLDPDLLEQAEITTATSVIILADTQHHSPQDADARSVVATLSVEDLNSQVQSEVRTVVEVSNDETAFHLRNARVDEIIQSGDLTADILAYSTSRPKYSKHLETLLRFTHKNNVVTSPVSERYEGKTISEVTTLLVVKRQILLGVRIGGSRKRETLDPSHVLGSKDEMVYIDIL